VTFVTVPLELITQIVKLKALFSQIMFRHYAICAMKSPWKAVRYIILLKKGIAACVITFIVQTERAYYQMIYLKIYVMIAMISISLRMMWYINLLEPVIVINAIILTTQAIILSYERIVKISARAAMQILSMQNFQLMHLLNQENVLSVTPLTHPPIAHF
jgi:hypothetical protein